MSQQSDTTYMAATPKVRKLVMACLVVLLTAIDPVSASDRRGRLIEGIACAADPSQTYTLYLPSDYDDTRRWPLMMIFDPRGRSVLAAELFLPAAERYGWILMSSDNTRSDGPMGPNIKAVNAMLPDAMDRYPSDHRRIYASGFSGGAMLAWTVGTRSGLLAGVIAAGGRVIPDVEDDRATWACFGAVGTTDFNNRDMRKVHEIIDARGQPNRLEFFDGPHSWMPKSLAIAGVEWMELLAMGQGRRPTDKELVVELYAKDTAAAENLERSGRLVEAMRRWQAIAVTFEDLTDVSNAVERKAALAKKKEVKQAIKAERRCDSTESQYLGRFWEIMNRLKSGQEPYPAGKLTTELGITDLQRQAAEGEGCASVTANRLLETAFTQASFYLTREFLESGRNRDAVATLNLAAQVKTDNPGVWYNLACAYARLGDLDESIFALARAVEYGFQNADHLEADPDLESLRSDPRFEALRKSIRKSAHHNSGEPESP